MSGDPQFINLPLIAAFLKSFSRTYLGPIPESTETLPEGMEELVPIDIQTKMRELFVGYFNAASKTLVKGQIVSLEFCRKLIVETPRAGQAQPRSVYQVWGDL
jgi:regulator of nonsense transcripts 2